MSLSELLKMHDFLLEECMAKFLPFTMAEKHPPFVFSKVILGLSFNMKDPWNTVFDYYKKY